MLVVIPASYEPPNRHRIGYFAGIPGIANAGGLPDAGPKAARLASWAMDMNGKVALVAGASKGIGAVTARAFAQAGASVILAARDNSKIEGVADGIIKNGGKALAVQTDVGDEDAQRDLVDQTLNRFGRLDAAFNNATDGPPPGPLAMIDTDAFDRGIRANIRGTFLGMKYQVPAMLASGGGTIVNMASLAGVQGVANLAAYVAGKAGIIALTKVAALDYADQGIRVNVVAPGTILTHHLERAGEQAQRGAARATPMGRIGQADEVADLVLWLCSEQSSYITGAVIPIDGGQSAGLKPPQMMRLPSDG
jgi:NAD(P)-dependent dehydrogenase (short-subunit alcohol dehydrogenase family)